MFNQLSGINAILYYLNDIFAHAGYSKVSGNLQAVAIGATNLLFTMIAMSVIDKSRSQDAAADRFRRHRHVSGRSLGHLLHSASTSSYWSGCWSATLPSSPFPRAR